MWRAENAKPSEIEFFKCEQKEQNTAKYKQIQPNTAKYKQIQSNTVKYRHVQLIQTHTR